MCYVARSRQQKQADTLSKIMEHFLDHAHLHETNMDSQLQNFLHDDKDRLSAHTNRLRDSRCSLSSVRVHSATVTSCLHA